MEKYKTCSNKIGCFPGEKYHIKLILKTHASNASIKVSSNVHSPTLQGRVGKIEEADIVRKVTGLPDLVNSITYRLTITKDGTSEIRLSLNPRDLNKQIRKEHHSTKTLNELLPLLHGKILLCNKHKEGILALRIRPLITSTIHLQYTICKIQVQTLAIWFNSIPRFLPTQNRRNLLWNQKHYGDR